MKNILHVLAILGILLLSSACGSTAYPPTLTPRPPTDTPLPTNTPLPTSTPVPPTDTPVPPTATSELPSMPQPSGTPLAYWNGIPVMPGAIAGEVDGQGYTFSIFATSEEVSGYYKSTMTALGWSLFSVGEGKNGSIMLFFLKETDLFTVSIIPGDPTLVMLV